MLNTISRSWLIGGWLATMAVIIALSAALGANLMTTAIALSLGAAPAIVTMIFWSGEPTPTVAEILHAADTNDTRR